MFSQDNFSIKAYQRQRYFDHSRECHSSSDAIICSEGDKKYLAVFMCLKFIPFPFVNISS